MLECPSQSQATHTHALQAEELHQHHQHHDQEE